MIRVSCIIATYGSSEWRDRGFRLSAEIAEQHPGFSRIEAVHLVDGTLAEARNQGAHQAEGQALVFLDADDCLAPGYLEAMADGLQPRMILSSDEDEIQESAYYPPHLLVPAVQYVREEDGFTQPPRIPQRGHWPALNECVIGTAVSRRLFEQVGGFREWPSLEDWDLWLRCYDAGARLAYFPDAVYIACVRAAGRNSDQSSYHAIWQEHLERIGEA